MMVQSKKTVQIHSVTVQTRTSSRIFNRRMPSCRFLSSKRLPLFSKSTGPSTVPFRLGCEHCTVEVLNVSRRCEVLPRPSRHEFIRRARPGDCYDSDEAIPAGLNRLLEDIQVGRIFLWAASSFELPTGKINK